MSISFVFDRFINKAGASEKIKAADLDNIKAKAAILEVKIQKLPEEMNSLKKEFLSIKDDIRYLSPNDMASAKELESEIKSLLESLGPLLSSETLDKPAIEKSLRDLKDQVVLRKKILE